MALTSQKAYLFALLKFTRVLLWTLLNVYMYLCSCVFVLSAYTTAVFRMLSKDYIKKNFYDDCIIVHGLHWMREACPWTGRRQIFFFVSPFTNPLAPHTNKKKIRWPHTEDALLVTRQAKFQFSHLRKNSSKSIQCVHKSRRPMYILISLETNLSLRAHHHIKSSHNVCVGFFSHYRIVSLCFFLVGLMSTAEFFGRSCRVSSLLTLVCFS